MTRWARASSGETATARSGGWMSKGDVSIASPGQASPCRPSRHQSVRAHWHSSKGAMTFCWCRSKVVSPCGRRSRAGWCGWRDRNSWAMASGSMMGASMPRDASGLAPWRSGGWRRESCRPGRSTGSTKPARRPWLQASISATASAGALMVDGCTSPTRCVAKFMRRRSIRLTGRQGDSSCSRHSLARRRMGL